MQVLFYVRCLEICQVFEKSGGYCVRLNLLLEVIVGCLFHLFHAIYSDFFLWLVVWYLSLDQIRLDSSGFLCPKLMLLEEGSDYYFVLAAFLFTYF